MFGTLAKDNRRRIGAIERHITNVLDISVDELRDAVTQHDATLSSMGVKNNNNKQSLEALANQVKAADEALMALRQRIEELEAIIRLPPEVFEAAQELAKVYKTTDERAKIYEEYLRDHVRKMAGGDGHAGSL